MCGLGWTFILSVYAGSAKKYSTPAAEELCSDPDEQMVMVAQAVAKEQYAANAAEEVTAEAVEQAQQDESSTGYLTPASSKL